MAITKLMIERALDELASFEEGFRFQALAIALARQKWPSLIAHEPKKDNGLDAYAPASVTPSQTGHGVACSITKVKIFEKIRSDAQSAREKFPDLRILTFATPHPVTQLTASKWAEALQKLDATKDVELIMMPRQEIITSLLLPENEGLCRSLLNMPPAETPRDGNLLERVLAATADIAEKWRARTHKNGRPTVALEGIVLDDEGKETEQTLDERALRDRLQLSRRTSLEGPGGQGKTTMLARLAAEHRRDNEVLLPIDLAGWIQSRDEVLDYVAKEPAFRARNITAADLAGLRQRLHFSFLLNGWNEIAESLSENAVVAMQELDRTYLDAGIIVATRAHAVSPPLPGCLRVRLRPLSRAQRTEYLGLTLNDRAEALRLRIEGSAVLEALTRTPLILNQVITLFEADSPIPETKVGVLEAAIKLLEDDHRSNLQAAPLKGRAERYLSELAHEMTSRGEIFVQQEDANRTIQSVVSKLAAEGQIGASPEPDAILQMLCAHHVLERVDYQTVTFRFQHQQFQEFFASRHAQKMLADLVETHDQDADSAFARSYLNQPIWEEPIFMAAEAIGHLIKDEKTRNNGEAMGERLIGLVCRIDPIFAADLAHSAGPLLWPIVRGELSRILRRWHQASDPPHQRLALAGMLATGSDDFLDIIGPSLSQEERNDRLRTYGYRFTLHLSSLGPDWRRTIATWPEDARSDFVYDMMHSPQVIDALEDLALSDPSAKVRRQAIDGLSWNDAQDKLGRVIQRLDEETLESVLPGLDDASLAPASRSTVARAILRSIKPDTPPLRRLGLMMRARRLGSDVDFADIKTVLETQRQRVDADGIEALRVVLDDIRNLDADWVSSWVSDRLIDGVLWGDHWNHFLAPMTAATRAAVVEELATTELNYSKLNAYKSLFSAEKTSDGAAGLFKRLSDLQSNRNPTTYAKTWKYEDQLRDTLRSVPLELAVAGINRCLPTEFDEGMAMAVTEFFGRVNADAEDVRESLSDEQRLPLRRYIKDAIDHALRLNVLSAETRSHAAVALGRLGDPQDIEDLRKLIDADIERMKIPPRPGTARMIYTNWYILSFRWLNTPSLEAYLLELLQKAEYESEASRALLQMAIPMDRNSLFVRGIAFDEIWKQRASLERPNVDEERAIRYAEALRQRIEHHRARRSVAAQAVRATARMKDLAVTLALIDGKRSADLVMEIMQLHEEWDEHARLGAVKALLISGASLTTASIFAVLNPVIDKMFQRGIHQDQNLSLLMHCLELLPFGDDPDRGVARIRQVVGRMTYRPHNIQALITALGYSRSKAAVPLLLHLAKGKGGPGYNAVHWVQALGRLATPTARRTLLAYVDPDVPSSGIQIPFDFSVFPQLADIITSWAREDDALRTRLIELVHRQMAAAQKQLLLSIYAELGSDEALLADTDHVGSSFHFGGDGPEELFIDRKQHGESGSYTLEARNAYSLRARLFQLAISDPVRRKAALSGLARIEVSRVEIGRPPGEPRHPMIESGKPWPPLDLLDFS